jgi:hypothetical protein
MGVIPIVSEVIDSVSAFFQSLPDFAKVILFVMMIQFIWGIFNLMFCPVNATIGFGALTFKPPSELTWCESPELFASVDAQGNLIKGSGITLFDSKIANAISLIVIFVYMLKFANLYLNYARG